MGSQVPIGDFSVMTRLSRKTLRHYHDLGLLEPAYIDARTGYRFYDTAQADQAHIIRRFRSLGMSIPDIKALLSTDDTGERTDIIAAHLRRMEDHLRQTQDAVHELSELLLSPRRQAEVELRTEPQATVWTVTAMIDIADVGAWFTAASSQLHEALRRSQVRPNGPAGGLYERELFTESCGEAALFVAVTTVDKPTAPVHSRVLPAAEYAVLTHCGTTHSEIDRSYAQLGAYVSEHLLSDRGPIREHYLGAESAAFTDFDRTEICWPIFGTVRPD